MANATSYHSELNDSPLLRDLSEAELKILFDHMEHLSFEPQELIISQGTQNKGLWLLADGCCEVLRSTSDCPKEQSLATLGPGAVFGEMSFFQKSAHSASIRCVTEVTAHQLSLETFQKLQANECQIAGAVLRNLVRVLAERLQLMDQWVCELIRSNKPEEGRQDEWHDFRAKLYSEWDFK
ncbi:MAG: Crp/Fnr family transcriptional regulator [Rubinisphaera brasiliensis]|uniref:Transcriptional regulator, Crp/Fnr family n=1 Tax=Rubinisphaera brasiliensis (strain ATCC 49424 / DSM 5305 / JCM 21570 / IAM 15109 / NBRC 103401 / IFAM 1448) TaxID=756272 RepID=F0SSP3_RUBBR|nr:cyclic nucleotide-binding domain-containing protein [Rubinisphaera brasiliensis]ADY60359.1 putative transcriptional regulator, Crp/Fnr family [Rubinisphaera brasiliensis DSM 5305]MBB03495.1 hypothetical protein [Planctomyces sp.]MBR9801872.1 cyclic nucleotide-binding domain-containing protein [bacterium]